MTRAGTRSRSVRGSRHASGHPEISWSIVLDAVLDRTIPVEHVADRLAAAWPADGSTGPPPEIHLSSDERWEEDRERAADRPYEDDGPLCRLLILPGERTRLLVGGHHAILDGLGLVAVLGAAIGESLGTTARGLQAPGPSPDGGLRYTIKRIREAMMRPPTRIAPRDGEPAAAGDHLVQRTLSQTVSSAEVIAACPGAVRTWNSGRAGSSGRVVVAVGAARTAGAKPVIGTQAAWFRLCVEHTDVNWVRAEMVRRGPEPTGSLPVLQLARRVGLARMMASRLGSTLLVSNLGSVLPAGACSSAAFFPAGHGRSGVAVGGIGVDGRTILTVRARRRDFSRAAAEHLLDVIADQVEAGRRNAAPRR